MQLGQVGYAKATMKDIAARAGVAQGLIGYHFGTKEALLVEVVREWMLNRGMREAMSRVDLHGSPAEVMQQALRHVVTFRKDNPTWFTLLISLWLESVSNEKLARELEKLYKEMRAGILLVLNQMELPLEQEDKETLAMLIQAVFDGLTLQSPPLLASEPIAYEQVSRGVDWMLDGVRTTNYSKGDDKV